MTKLKLITLTLTASAAALVTLALPGAASACSFALPETHELDAGEQQVDTTAPARPEVTVDFVRRPATEPGGCGATMHSSCDGSGEVLLEVAPTSDDRSQPDQIGYLIEFAGGTPPTNMSLPTEPVRADGAGMIWLLFSDEDQPLDFALSIRAVDLAGNHGEPVMVEVIDSDSAGCSAIAARTTAMTWGLVVIALLCAIIVFGRWIAYSPVGV